MIYRIKSDVFVIVFDVSNLIIGNKYIIEGMYASKILVGKPKSKPLTHFDSDKIYTLHDSIMSSIYTTFDVKRAVYLLNNPEKGFFFIKKNPILYAVMGDEILDDEKRTEFLVKKIYTKEELLNLSLLL